MELLIMIDSFLRASAYRITAVLPYFGYARQDRKDAGRVPITAKLVANIITRAGTDRVLAMDLHAAQLQGFFDVPVDHLYAAPVLNEYFRGQEFKKDELVIVSADEGGIKRALGHATRLGAPLAVVDKRRTSPDSTKQENIIGASVKGKTVLMFDDMISTASSICGAAKVLKENGARAIHVAATHGVLVGPAIERLSAMSIDSVAITDTIPLRPEQMLPKIKILSVAALLGQAIKRIHRNESVSMLFV
jgi:ribose-phosphate pyrophosphokinase